MTSPLTLERRNKLAEILINEGSVKVGKLADMFGVSTETIRKDLIFLDQQGIATKAHGGAIRSGSILTTERPLNRKTDENLSIKNKIASKAIEFIPEKGVVIFDTGSTTQCVANALINHSELTIITNALNIVEIMSNSSNDIYLVGGKFNSFSRALVGMWGMNVFDSINVDVVFLGADGLSGRHGPCTASYEEAETKKAMVRCATTKIVVCDSSKFTSRGLFQYSDWSDIDYLITDSEIPEHELIELKKLTEVLIVE